MMDWLNQVLMILPCYWSLRYIAKSLAEHLTERTSRVRVELTRPLVKYFSFLNSPSLLNQYIPGWVHFQEFG